MTAADSAWREINQRALILAIARVRDYVQAWLADGADAANQEPAPLDDAQVPAGTTLPSLHAVCRAFRLSAFERDVLLLCAGVDLDGDLATSVGQANGDPRRTSPTFGLALAALPGAHWSALSPSAPLRYWRLIEVGPGETLTSSPLRIDERVLHYLAGVPSSDDRVHPLLERNSQRELAGESQRRAAENIARSVAANASSPQVVQLSGGDRSDLPAVATTAAAMLGMSLYRLQARDIPAPAAERSAMARLVEREAVLSQLLVLVDLVDADAVERDRVCSFVNAVGCPVFLATSEILSGLSRDSARIHIGEPLPREERDLWRQTIGPLATRLNGGLDAVTRQFRFTTSEIAEAGGRFRFACEAESAMFDSGDQQYADKLWDACRLQARAGLEALAARVESSARWDDLVLPDAALRTLHEIAAHVRQSVRVYEHWGFAARSTRGLGISALFVGPSGTGKTMAAEVLANELKLDLFRIDLSAVVSKYIGETEKNLKRVFDAADAGGSLLLFDEADALFGKRSEVRDSHDRYANIEVGYLLQRIESYRGLAILTTNMKNALDQAFLRRLRFVIQFPFPERPERELMWQRAFPPATPTAGLVIEQLAGLNVTGGNIRNIAMNAAFLAADAAERVGMKHVALAARSEFVKLDRPLNGADFGEWS